MLKNFFYYRPFADRTLCHFLKQRLVLPDISLQGLFPNFNDQPVTLNQLPCGAWSTPLADIVMLLKVIVCTQPKKLMEVGSFRGYTALYMAQHISPDAKIVTVDRYPEHGEAYLNTPYASIIERRVGETNTEMFQQDSKDSYDLIFIDADHSYSGVKNDTELVLPLVSQNGFIVWHDYANWGYFDGKNGVPEYLKELSEKLPIAHITGSDVAIYSPAWAGEKKHIYESAIQQKVRSTEVNPWNTDYLRG
ncbi:O-methyltransferase [Anabaena sp. UHCC 0204]|uniref:O-methyltransferase n=1 Tax=Anabaena sp. UHCC 0204 TaxID=2590009 RepID=UPI001448319A|nr:class I SAM-dependent methyltransferase [Anabaena sp. UHCC 0204]MTJ07924.1 class I SAM-dependent methyltransferase [Anabaena sp. UHCC 0204]